MVLCKFEQGINIFLTDNLKTDALAGSEDQYKMPAKYVQIKRPRTVLKRLSTKLVREKN